MALASCSKDDNGGGFNSEPKSVTVKLPNIAPADGTRATGNAVAANSQVALTNYKIFFVGSDGNAVTVPQFEGAEQQVYFSSEESASWDVSAEKTFHLLPASTAKVVVVGNIGDVEYNTLAARTDNVPNDGTANANGYDADGHPYYPLYGESNLTAVEGTDDEGHNNVYEANVTLEPRVSRFEIYGFEYATPNGDGASNKYTKVELQKIALNHYYTSYNFVSKTPVETGKVFDNPNNTTAWDWIINQQMPWADELTLTLNSGEKKFVNGTTISDENEDGEGATDIITYGLAHVAEATNNPELLLAMVGTDADGNETPVYLRGQFTSKAAFESGKIYRVFYSFTDESFDEPTRCVELTVNVANWTVVAVTPSF